MTTRSDSIASRLDLEWEHLRRRPGTVRRARAWADLECAGAAAPLLARLTDLQALIESTRGYGASDHVADALLCRLLEITDRDPLAGRVVIQRILPGLIAKSVRYRSHRDAIDPVEVVVASAWIAIRNYDWHARNRHVAASLISDATFQAFRRPLRRRSATEETRPPHEFKRIEARPDPASTLDELAIVLRDGRRAGVPAPDLELLRQLVRTGSPRQIAQQCGVTPRTIRNRRDAAISRLRSALVP